MPVRASFKTVDLGQIKDDCAAKLPACVDIEDVVRNYEALRELPLHDLCLPIACFSFIHPCAEGKSGISLDIRKFQSRCQVTVRDRWLGCIVHVQSVLTLPAITPSGNLTSEAEYGLRLAAVLSPRCHVKHRCLHVCSHGTSHFVQKSLAVALCQDTQLLLNHVSCAQLPYMHGQLAALKRCVMFPPFVCD